MKRRGRRERNGEGGGGSHRGVKWKYIKYFLMLKLTLFL